MPEILYEDEGTLIILACEWFHGLTQAEVREWETLRGDRELQWYNVLSRSGITGAMMFARVSPTLTRKTALYLHTCLHLYDEG